MSGDLRKVRTGDPLRIPARAYIPHSGPVLGQSLSVSLRDARPGYEGIVSA
jgi:hypothetical protein